MIGYWEVIAPVAIAAMGGVVLLARRLRHPPGGHRADLARLELEPLRLYHERTIPVAKVEGLPPWAAPEADRYSGYGWDSGSSGSSYGGGFDGAGDGLAAERSLDWAARNDLAPDLEATLRRELHHVDDLDLGPGAGVYLSPGYKSRPAQSHHSWRMKADRPALAGLPREDGAGDESEASGPSAPPAPLTATDLALARCDLFMTAMRADHVRWLASARERWAA